MCQHVDVCKAGDGVVYNQHEAVFFGQLLEARQICALQGRVAWKLDNNKAHVSALLGLSFEPCLHFIKTLLVDLAKVLESAGALLEQMVLGVVEDYAEDDVGSRAVLLDEICGVEDASHAAGVEMDIVGFALHQLRVNRGAVDKLVDAFTKQLVSRASGRKGWLGGVLVIIKRDFNQAVNVAQQVLCNANGESKAGIAPAKHQGLGMLRLKYHGVDTMPGHVDTFEDELLRVNGSFIPVRVLDVAGSIREHDGVEVDHAAFALVAQLLCYLLAELRTRIYLVSHRCCYLELV